MTQPIHWTDDPTIWTGAFEGCDHGSGIAIIFARLEPGKPGPKLHKHPYAETFIVRRGQVLFSVANEHIAASAGDIVVVPAETPHAFANAGDDVLEMTDIHANARLTTIWLED